MARWEYFVAELRSRDEMKQALIKFGNLGWELVQAHEQRSWWTLVFKRKRSFWSR